MTEKWIFYILIAMAAGSLICLLIMIFVNRGLNREVSSMVKAYQNLTMQVDDLKDDNQHMSQALQGTIKVFGDILKLKKFLVQIFLQRFILLQKT